MSRTDLPVATETPDPRRTAPSTPERPVESSARLGISREAARAEMERFRGVAEYETRKLFGERTALRQPMEPMPSSKKSRRRSSKVGSHQVQATHTQARQESAAQTKTGTSEHQPKTDAEQV